jgi:hypothetical protein
VGLSVGLFLQNELKRGIYGKSAKRKNRFSNNLSKFRGLENSGVLTTKQKVKPALFFLFTLNQ